MSSNQLSIGKGIQREQEKTSLLQKDQVTPEDDQAKEAKSVGLYGFLLLALVTSVRSIYVVQKNSIGYAYGFEGTDFRANNPVYMLQAAFPNLGPIYGIVASLMFSVAYSTSNIFMSSQTKNWDKRRMLSLAVVGMGLTSLVSSGTNSLLMFAMMRFVYGICASAINVPIY
mmetsp:Transcript_7920/g.13288  ORF Transcript_7920/g.13288 Transcript_7920/m.13288 type:complete len:171 (+) Transcript_7920:684-1196(+)